jgi:hypothetical protein
MSTRWKSLVALAAMAATPVLVAIPSGSADAAVKKESTISIRAEHKRVEAGEQTRVRGNLNIKKSNAEPGTVVTLEARPDGEPGFAPIGTAVAGAQGGLRIDVTPAVTTRYRWFFPGDAETRASRSGVARIVVGPKQGDGSGPNRIKTTLSVRATDRPVDAQGDSLVRGKLLARGIDIPNREVLLLARTAGQAFAPVAMQRTDRDGVVRFPVSPSTKTAYRLRFEGTRILRPTRSGVVRVGVRPVVEASATPTAVDPGELTTVSGVVSFEGAPYVGATVDLLARNAKKKRARFGVVATGTTDATGAVSFAQSPTRSTVYRLVVRHSEGTPPRAVSNTVRVRVAAPTSLSIRGRELSTAYKVSGVLRGGGSTLGGRIVALELLGADGTTWTIVALDKTGRKGKAEFRRVLSEGSSYRLSHAGGPRFAPSVSGVVVN